MWAMQNCCRSAVPVSFDVDSADIWKRIMGKLEVLEVYLGILGTFSDLGSGNGNVKM
jgi:hypothetical protein